MKHDQKKTKAFEKKFVFYGGMIQLNTDIVPVLRNKSERQCPYDFAGIFLMKSVRKKTCRF